MYFFNVCYFRTFDCLYEPIFMILFYLKADASHVVSFEFGPVLSIESMRKTEIILCFN